MGCIFAPYFDSDQGASVFASVHKVFGASNVSKLLHHIPPHKRLDAVITVCYEAQARLRDPVYGCVAHIFAIQQQVYLYHYTHTHTRTRTRTHIYPSELFIFRPSTARARTHTHKNMCVYAHIYTINFSFFVHLYKNRLKNPPKNIELPIRKYSKLNSKRIFFVHSKDLCIYIYIYVLQSFINSNMFP